MEVTIKKLEDRKDALHPNNIETGFEKSGLFVGDPVVGEAFWLGGHWRTSPVVEILSANTFKTLNSVYQWTIKKEVAVPLKLDQGMRDEEFALNDMQNKVYSTAVTYFEKIGENNHLRGNGHHAAQRIAEFAKKEWLKMSKNMSDAED